MGSGSSGLYFGTRGGSQPYALSYSVTPQMLEEDKKDPDIYAPKKGYFLNPTAVKLCDAISGNAIMFNGHHANGNFTYVMDESGNIIFGKRLNPNDEKNGGVKKRCPHPTLIGGIDPKVKCAGIIVFRKGRIVSANTNSGHYKPNIKSLEEVDKLFSTMCVTNKQLFDKKSKWRKLNEN